MKYELEEEAGGYVRNGDVLEWHWKAEPSEPEPDEEQEPPKRKPGRPKKTTN